MSTNAALARRFEQMARLLEVLGEDRFRVNAHARAARTIESLPRDIRDLATDRKALLALEGVGPKVADKIEEFLATGSIQEYADLLARVPPGLLGMMEIPGVGPKTAKAIWETIGVTTVAGLKQAIDDDSILTVPRMGKKAAEKILASIAIAAEGAQRLPIGLALPLAERVAQTMGRAPGVTRVAYAGSLRRGKETAGDIDILVTTDSPAEAHRAFCAMPGVRHIIASGATRSSIRLPVGESGIAPAPRAELDAAPSEDTPIDPDERTVQVDLRAVPPESWGAALMYFTGSKEHNIRLRERAQRRGLTLNEYGLYPADDDPEPPHNRGVAPVAAATEAEIYRALGLPEIPPEIREDRAEITAAEQGRIPTLIRLQDIRAELHAHTTASDGSLSIEALADEAARRGFHTIAVTDHSRSSVIAGGLSPERLREHLKAIRAAAASRRDITILAGSEVDILADGALDYDDDTLDLLDTVVASPHAALGQDTAAATRRLVRAIEHPCVRILGHPTGRLIGRRSGLSPDMGEVFAAACEHNVALEINAHWLRLDLRDTHIQGAVEAGCLLAINCDVHAPADFDNLRYGVLTARRGWLTPDRCINCWDGEKLRAWIRDR